MNNISFKEFEYEGWQSVSNNYKESWVNVTNMFGQEIVSGFDIKDKSILDVATGIGNMIPILNNYAPLDIKAIDISENMINIAKKEHPSFKFYIADITDLPFDDGLFDFVVSNFGVQHFYNIERSFSEIYRVLKPGGVFSFTIWADDNLNLAGYVLNKAIADCRISGIDLPTGPDYHIFNNYSLLKKLISICGFNEGEIKRSLVKKTWKMNSVDDLFNSEKTGSVRSGALLKSLDFQTNEKLKLKMRDIIQTKNWHNLPMAAYIISIRKNK
ncbi:hypothetical protein GCM10023078_19720 [Gibbsiella greigii]